MEKRGIKSRRESFFILIVLSAGILFLALNSVYAQGDSYYCAERTTNGAWCQNVPWNEVDTSYDYTQTSCEATAFCKTGTCVNAVEGSCRPNVPQRVCEASGGIWDERERDEISQCQLGCCYIGSGASFVTQTKCTSQASRYGVEISFDPGIRDPIKCIASAYPEEKGACVTDDGFVRNCKMKTSAECDSEKAGASGETTVEFHRGTLCTAAHLETICAPTERTTLIEGRDEVFFVDSCENPANIYDASKIGPAVQDYWDYMVDKADSCALSPDLGNTDICGNCDYLGGSIGKRYDRGNPKMFSKAPRYGDYICADLGCKSGEPAEEFYERFDRFPEHGESWCGTSVGSEDNLPGSEHFRFICDYGGINIEQGDPFRQTLCIESEIPVEGQEEGFKIANFRANLWEKCVLQDNKEDCEDVQERDCVWIEGVGATLQTIHADEEGNTFAVNSEGELVSKDDLEEGDPGVFKNSVTGSLIKIGIGAACVPKYPPALHFWEPNKTREEISSENAGTTCAIGSEVCIVKFEDPMLFGATTCKENCYCLGLEKGDDPARMGDGSLKNIKLNEENEWLMNNTKICELLGDCGASESYIGEQGHWELEDLVEVTEIKEGEGEE